MNKNRIREMLLEECSKAQIHKILNYISRHPETLDLLWEAFHSEEDKLPQRAAWAIQHYYRGRENDLTPILSTLKDSLQKPAHPAQLRSVLSILQFAEIPEEEESYFYELGLRKMCDSKAPSAIRVFGMHVASNIAQKYPELAEEVIHSYELLESRTAGLKSRWKKLYPSLKSTRPKEQA